MDMTLYLSYKAAPTYYYFKDKNRKYCYKYTDKKLSLVSGEKDVCNIVKSEKWKMKSEKWKVKNEKWKVKNEKWKMKSEKWKMKSEKWKVKSEKWKVKNEKFFGF